MLFHPIVQGFQKFYLWFISFFSHLQSALLLLLRITWGHQFFLVGLSKLHKIERTMQFLDSLYIPFPPFSAFFLAFLEIIGGFCLLVGLGSRFFALLLSLAMFVAYGTAHAHVFKDFHFVFDPSLLVKEAPFPFLLTSLITLAFGPGKISLDGWIKRWVRQKERYG